MALQPEQQARLEIERLLVAAGWHVCDVSKRDIHLTCGVAIREFPLSGFGFADYLLYIDGKAAGVIEAHKLGASLTGVERQCEKYTEISFGPACAVDTIGATGGTRPHRA